MFIHKNLGRALRFAMMTLVAVAFSVSAWAQNISVSGTVTDKSGEPVIGAYILVQGTTNGTSTDIVAASIRAYINALNKIVFEEA